MKKSKQVSGRVKINVKLYNDIGRAYKELANLYGLNYDELGERMLISGIESHLRTIDEMMKKETNNNKETSNASQQDQQPTSVVQAGQP